jgi:hypothetical protein
MENKKRTDLEECVIHYKGNYYLKTDVGYKKIILTTDTGLIKNGIQAIDDEFLEWFVKNPSCEWVEVKEKRHFEADKSKRINPLNGVYYSYKIIIPKKEPTDFLGRTTFDLLKQEAIEEEMKEFDKEESNYNMKSEILDEMEKQIAFTQEMGEKIVKYLEKYKGQSIYNEIAVAIEFGYHLKQEEDEK